MTKINNNLYLFDIENPTDFRQAIELSKHLEAHPEEQDIMLRDGNGDFSGRLFRRLICSLL